MWRFLTSNSTQSTSKDEKKSEEEVQVFIDQEIRARQRTGPNRQYSDELRAKIAKYAAENGNCRAVAKYNVPESTVRNFKKEYLCKLKEMKSVTSLPVKKTGRPLKLGALDSVVQRLVKFMVVNLLVHITIGENCWVSAIIVAGTGSTIEPSIAAV